jgi:uncharacterized membrane protein
MNHSPGPKPARPSNPLLATLQALFRTRVTAGLLTVLPIYVTWIVVTFVFGLMRDSSIWAVDLYLRSTLGRQLLDSWLVPAVDPVTGRAVLDAAGGPTLISLTEKLTQLEAKLGHPATLSDVFGVLPVTLQWGISIFSVLLTIFLLYAIGLLTANLIGRRVLDWLESLVDRLPLVKTVYRSVKQIVGQFGSEQQQSFQRVALVPFPTPGMRAVGFITNVTRDDVTGQELVTLFIPTTPNPTTGFFQILPKSDVVEVPWSVEEAIRAIMSGGILRPSLLTLASADEVARRGVQSSAAPASAPAAVAGRMA